MGELPLPDGARLLLNWLAQREQRCLQLGYLDDARRYRSYARIVERLRDAANPDPSEGR